MTEIQLFRQDIRRYKPSLRRKYGVRSLGVFGSYVRGEQRPKSDLDLLVELDAPIGLIRFNELERRLGVILGVKVDLVVRDALKPHIGRHVLDEVASL